jgi:hypothetical protein
MIRLTRFRIAPLGMRAPFVARGLPFRFGFAAALGDIRAE